MRETMMGLAREWRREFVARAFLEGALRLASWPVAWVAVILAVDRFSALPQAGRIGLLFFSSAAWAMAAFFLLCWPLLRFDWGVVLSAAESRFPDVKPYLKTAWDLRRAASPHTSEDLRRAHLERTDLFLRRLPDHVLFPWRPSGWVKSGVLAAALGGSAITALSDPAAWQRLFAPWDDPALESFVAVSPGDLLGEWGKPVTIEARWTARPAPWAQGADLRLWLKGQGLPWRATDWDASSQERGSFVIAELVAPVEYRVTWKGVSSRGYRLTPSRAPGWKSLQARVRSPQGAVTVLSLSPAEELSAYRGSHVTITGEPTEALSQARLRFSGGAAPVDLNPAPDGGAVEAGGRAPPAPSGKVWAAGGAVQGWFVVTEDAVFHFELSALDGRTDQAPDAYRLRALTDQPPKADLLSPTAPLQASRHDVLPVAYAVSDDLGLSRVCLRYKVGGGPEVEAASRAFAWGAKELFGDFGWDLQDLPHGAVAEFWIEAQDDAPRPQKALSAKGSVEIVDFESLHLETYRRGTSAQNNISGLVKAHAGVLSLIDELEVSTRPGGGLADLEGKLSGLPGAWRITVGSVSDLAASMGSDVYSNAGLAESMRSLAEDLGAVEKGSLPAAVEASRKRDWALARKLHQRLSAKLRAALSGFDSSRKLQRLQDFYSQAGRMTRSAESLESALDAARQGAARQAQAKLSESLNRIKSLLSQFVQDLSELPSVPADPSASRQAVELPLTSAVASLAALEAALKAGDFERAAALARRLAEDLARLQHAVGDIAAGALGFAGGPTPLDDARRLWSEAVDEQARSLEATRAVHRSAMDRLLEEQKSLLAQLADRQRVLVSSATRSTAKFPAEALSEMRAILAELESAKIERTAVRLTLVSSRLRAASLPPSDRGCLEYFAAEEDSIRRRLEDAPKTPPARPGDAACRGAAAQQSAARSKTRMLQSGLEALPFDAMLPAGAIERVEGAQTEQAAAEDALGRGDSSAAVGPQEEALRLLEVGLSDLERSMESQRMSRTVLRETFSSPLGTVRQGRGGRAGADTGFVPLPRARDYVPPREIRDELERSLKERRPRTMDGVIKEYFKRIAQ
ncbi:MAG: hypothetical protein HY748_12535 [Elusimicrobia bacterium]|nr:hypothetical protein [Elusimicrobiota bacterium]